MTNLNKIVTQSSNSVNLISIMINTFKATKNKKIKNKDPIKITSNHLLQHKEKK